MERISIGIKLAADQSATPLGSPLQTGPPLPTSANLRRRRRPAIALRLSNHDNGRDDPTHLAARDESAGAGMAQETLPRDQGLDAVQKRNQPDAPLSMR